MGKGRGDDHGAHGKLCTGEFSCTCACLLAVMVVVFFATSQIGHVEEELERELEGYDEGSVARATFSDARMEGLVAMRSHVDGTQEPTKVIVGLMFNSTLAPRGEYEWGVADDCSGAGRVDLTLAHGVLRNLELDGGLCVLVTYDQELRLEGENSVVGKSVLISQSGEAGGTRFCAPIEAAEAEEGEEGR